MFKKGRIKDGNGEITHHKSCILRPLKIGGKKFKGSHRLQSVDKLGGRGFCRAKDDSEWRLAIGFLEGSVPALPPKIPSVVREHDPPVKNPALPKNFGSQQPHSALSTLH